MRILTIISLGIWVFCAQSCADKEPLEVSVNPATYNETWTEQSHSKDADPNYSLIFPQNEVLRIDVNISAANWETMEQDLATNIADGGPGPGGPGPGGPGGGGPEGGVDLDSDFTPVWVPCLLTFNEKQWNNVGIRFKGNSSLQSVYHSNGAKFSFKLDFDEFEDDYPEIKNQRFYGFKQLNLNNNFGDYSVLHEKVAPDLFREFGVAAPQTSFVSLYVNTGSGEQYYGLYTLVEEVDNTMIPSQFTFTDGNLYKPEGAGATFASGSYNENDMYKKSNEEANDYTDVENFYKVLHSASRTEDAELWKTELEAIFDVPVFLKWLAVNASIQNWDTYGRMSHNYYLYNNPERNTLQWIPWDNNEAFNDGKQGGAVQIDLSDVGSDWPIINYIISIADYEEMYKNYLRQFNTEVFYPEKMIASYTNYYNLVKAHVYQESPEYSFTSAAAFESEIEFLKQHVSNRNKVVESYIN